MELFPSVAMEIQQAHPLLHGLQNSPCTGDRWEQADFEFSLQKSFPCNSFPCKESSHPGAGTVTKRWVPAQESWVWVLLSWGILSESSR